MSIQHTPTRAADPEYAACGAAVAAELGGAE